MNDTHISVRGLNAYYGKHRALNDINVEIPRHKITVILGPSGCGKTTLLKSLNRLLDITDGVKVTGQVLRRQHLRSIRGRDGRCKRAGLLS
jgi:phosphate transport system ATP-binding protein